MRNGLIRRQFTVPMPSGETLSLNNTDLDLTALWVKGPLGQLFVKFSNYLHLKFNNDFVFLTAYSRYACCLGGTLCKSIWAYAKGVNRLFFLNLETRGLGYSVLVKQCLEGVIVFSLGRSHSVKYKLPSGVKFLVTGLKNRSFRIFSFSWNILTDTAARLKLLKEKSVYNVKGIFFRKEKVKVKEGKKKKFR